MSSWMYRPNCISRLRRVIQGIEFKKKRTFPQPSIMDIQEQLKPKIGELQTGLQKEIEAMMKCVNEDYSIKEQELEKIDDNEVNNFVDRYEYRTKQMLEMMEFLIGALETACNNEKEMLESLENDSTLADIVKYITECEEEEIKLKEKEEMMKSKHKEEINEHEHENGDDNKNENSNEGKKDKDNNDETDYLEIDENENKENEDKKENEDNSKKANEDENEDETKAHEDEVKAHEDEIKTNENKEE